MALDTGLHPDIMWSNAYAAWRQVLGELTTGEQRFTRWREHRYTFAHHVGILLTQAHPPARAVAGHALYGVSIEGTGLCYVGQTTEAERRLRDLPIGESHHLAATVPPELWTRVIVVQWPQLLSQVPAEERKSAEGDLDTCGMALEHLLHCEFHPVINCFKRTTDGHYRERPPERSQSKGAISASKFPKFFASVLQVWSELEATPGDSPTVYKPFGRIVFPATFA